MFKRILVLALFLLGVFWWMGQKDGKIEKGEIIEKTEIEQSADTENNSEEADKSKTEDSENDKSEENTEAVELITKKGEEKTVVEEKIKTSNKSEVNNSKISTTAKTVTKTYTTPRKVWKPKPIVKKAVEEIIPERQINIKTYMYEWNIDFSKKVFQSGTINFQIKNNGRFSHEFGIETIGSLGKIMPGEQKTFTVKLKPGTYEVFSKRRSDYEKGMKDMITVTK